MNKQLFKKAPRETEKKKSKFEVYEDMLGMIFIVNFKITRKTNLERENFKPRDKQKYEFKYERLKCKRK